MTMKILLLLLSIAVICYTVKKYIIDVKPYYYVKKHLWNTVYNINNEHIKKEYVYVICKKYNVLYRKYLHIIPKNYKSDYCIFKWEHYIFCGTHYDTPEEAENVIHDLMNNPDRYHKE